MNRYKASYFTRTFDFHFPAGTSRGVLLQKTSSFIVLEASGELQQLTGTPDSDPTHLHPAAKQASDSGRVFLGIGECSTIPDLSPDPMDRYAARLQELCEAINQGTPPEKTDLQEFPSIRFGLEMAMLEMKRRVELAKIAASAFDDFLSSPHLLFPSAFTRGEQGIPINGLIWMGDKAFMQHQIARKLNEGYRCLKMKVGALDFDTELEILREIRKHFSPDELEIRVDANGAFGVENALQKLNDLAQFRIHSIEQPIRQGQHEAMATLCRLSPIPIALDEELISFPPHSAESLLKLIRPAYIILKPSLLGGFAVSRQWIDAAEATGTGWWVTSALESNIGLNAIAQWTFTLNNPLPQGLGTGQLYTNNIPSWLEIKNAFLTVN
jgi:o-succinylbenzoate synthase